jgi:hypothetical protein
MDQLKEILRQAIKYRFWIAVVIAALLPVVGYAVGAGTIKQEAAKQANIIKAANNDVKQYASGVVANNQYKPILAEKNEEITKDVDASWRKLYARQASLLTWPERVDARFRKWGRKWPEDVDASTVQLTIDDYVHGYPEFVEKVFQSFKPYDVVEGTGIVLSPPKETLLRPAQFKSETLPSLGEVWSAQERLWIQRTLLDVIAKVNKDAKDWDAAYIKQVNLLNVGSMEAQDQRSMAKGDQLEEAPPIEAPGAAGAEAGAEAGAGLGAGMADEEGFGGRFGGGMMQGKPDVVYYIHTDSPQFKILPVQMIVLVDQTHVQDFLVGLENSPMSVQVEDIEIQKPSTRVVKPEKGEAFSFGDYDYGFRGRGRMGREMMGMFGRGMTSFGGRGMYAPGGYGMRGRGSEMDSDDDMGFGRFGAARAPAKPQRKGIDVRGKDTKAKRKEELEAVRKAAPVVLHDPYYNIIEVTVYGQARFYNPPPEAPPAEPSQSQTGEPAAPNG